MEDRQYAVIRDAVLARVMAAKTDAQGNLQNLNVLLEGFYREFLNILMGWKLKNANAEKQNFPGVDLIDRENGIAVQVSGTCDHKKIQHSLTEFKEPGNWHFYFLPITDKKYKPTNPFTHAETIAFDPAADILDTGRLLSLVQNADAAVRAALEHFIELEKAALWEHYDNLLRETRQNHPSFRLMEPDKLDRRLYPRYKGMRLAEARGKTGDRVSPLWEVIRDSWRGEENRSVVIEGAGGIGKTVSLLSITEAGERWCPAPAVYIPMHRLLDEEGNCVKLSAYLKEQSATYGENLPKLAERPWEQGPQVILLLDGFNEVRAEKRREILHQINDWRATKPGAQLIAVSRPMDGLDLKTELAGNPISCELEPLEREAAENWLLKQGITPPAAESRVWESLRYPLFLTLYAKTAGLEGRTSDGYPLAPKKAESGGALIWNYLQRQLLIEEREKWVLPCAVACEYILPYIAYRMAQEERFTIERKAARALIEEAVKTLDASLPRHLTAIFERYDEEHEGFPDFSGTKWGHAVLREVGVLVPSGEKNFFAFLHQNFRDALAGLYLVNQAEMAAAGELPELWRRGIHPRLMDYAAELMEEGEAEKLWEANRLLHRHC